MIKGSDLENRQDRGQRTEDPQDVLKRPRGKLTDRLNAARALKPPKDLGRPHCGCCYGRGRDEAVRIIEGVGTED